MIDYKIIDLPKKENQTYGRGGERKFADWIKGRIDKYAFEESYDFCVSEKKKC